MSVLTKVAVPADVMQHLLVHRVEPVLPGRPKAIGLAVLAAHIARDGSVTSLRPVSGPDVLTRSAMDAVQWWKFEPYRLNGEPVHFHRPLEARRRGIEIVYQDLALCDNLTASANVFLGRELTRTFGPFRLLDYRTMYARAGALFAELKSETRPRDLVRHMSGGQRQAVAIARTRLSDPRIVLLDEPTAAISIRQVAEVLDLIRRLRDQGIAVVLISHRMPDVFAVADRVLVLRRGRRVAEKPITQSSPEEITGLITGAIDAA